MLASGFDPVVYGAIRVDSLASTTCRFRLYSVGAVSLALLTGVGSLEDVKVGQRVTILEAASLRKVLVSANGSWTSDCARKLLLQRLLNLCIVDALSNIW